MPFNTFLMSTAAPISPYERERLQTALKCGFSFFCIKSDDSNPGFIYSVGMAQFDMPDILMFIDSEYVTPQMNMLTTTLQTMIEGSKRFDSKAFTATLNGFKKVVTDPEIEYTFTLLNSSECDYAISNYMCRCHYFRRIFKNDPTVLVISSDFNPSWNDVTALVTA